MGPALIEPIAARGWRAAVCERLGGWRLYASAGLSGRLNTCWPLGDPGMPPDAAIVAAEAWYAARRLPPRFKLTEGLAHPADLAARLERRGYVRSIATLTMVGPLLGSPDPDVAIESDVGRDFREVFADPIFGPHSDAAERVEALGRIPQPRGYALARVAGAPAAVGACAVEGRWAGLMAMRTSPAYRRRGLARRVFRGLCAFARESGAQQGYLQVEEDNPSAIALYRSEGFENRYAYHYWAKAASAAD